MAKQNGTTRSPQSRSSSPGRSSSTPKTGKRGGAKRSAKVQERPAAKSPRLGAIADVGTKAVSTVRENPIPAALVAAGLTWLIVKNRERLSMPSMPGALSGIADTARESFTDMAQSTRQAVRGGVDAAAESVKGGAATVADYAQSGASTVGQVARKGFEKGRDVVATTWDEHPLTVGIALLAAGVAAGMMLPAPKGAAITRAAKGLTQRVTSTGEELLHSARELVSSSARAVSSEAKRQGLTPAQISRKVKRVADAAMS